MTNKEIAKTFQELAAIMELHGENPFKIRSYNSAYINLRKLETPLSSIPQEELGNIKGVGKAISGKITELLENGKMETLERYKSQTPIGIQEMLRIKGFGVKKIRTIWKEMEIETIGELLYAVNENRLIELKGFGKKTQADLKAKLEYYQKSKKSFHYATLEADAFKTVDFLKNKLPDIAISLVGAMRRCAVIADSIEILIAAQDANLIPFDNKILTKDKEENGVIYATSVDGFPVIIRLCAATEYGSKLFQYTANEDFMKAFIKENKGTDFQNIAEEQAVFEKANLPYIAAELREQEWAIDLAKTNKLPQLVEEKDIKGVVHCHSTYSDGLHTLEEMATYTKAQGFEYLIMTDHSQAAFYANGLKPDRVLQQMEEIDALNEKLAPFKIFKSIECDILNDGSLDYEEDVLAKFDCVIASVHSNLRMDKEKATQRLLTAIANPYTTILGHPTGRLLLSREGYPIDHCTIIDACAAHNVIIELNANPHRLDLDWTWIPYALEKGVKISINPDAHSKEGIHHIKYGVLAARKGGLTAEMCFNTQNRVQIEQYFSTSG